MSVVIDGTSGITTPAETVQGALTTTGNTILGDASTDTLNVASGTLVTDGLGNVGIGTATPLAKLEIRGTPDANWGNTVLFDNRSVAINQGGMIAFGGYKTGTSAQSTFGQIAGGKENATSGNEAGYLSFSTNNNVAYVERMRIDSSGNLLFNSGYGSAATAYGCRAWVNFNGTGTVAIRASGNVSSITDNGVGEYTVNFTTALVDANYAGLVTAGDYGASARSAGGTTNATRLTGSYAIRTLNAVQSATTDCDSVYFSVFR